MTEKNKRTKKRLFKMPSAFAILFGIIAFMAALTWIIPSGQYALTDGDDPTPIAGTYERVEKVTTDEDGVTTDTRQGAWEVFQAPIKGTIDAIDVALFVLILGGFLGVTMKTGALDALFGKIIRKLKGRERWMIPILMTFFAIGGTTYGMQEETVAFYALVVPIVLAAGYNGLTAAMIIILGAGVGVLGSTINPFSTGIASGFAGVSLGDGIVERLVILVLSLIAAIWFTMAYAAKVKAGQRDGDSKRDHKHATAVTGAGSAQALELTPARKATVWVFALTFLVMILAVIPWAYKFDITFFEDFNAWLLGLPVIGAFIGNIPPLGDWWFNELSALFLISSVIIGLIYFSGKNRSDDEDENYFGTFISGAKDLLAVALIIGVARGVSVVMSDGQIMATIINAGEQLLQAVPSVILPGLAFIVYLPLSFLLPSTSGLATATMPILAPLADFASIDRSLMVTAFQTAAGVINMIAPTVASVMGGLALAKVSYGIYLKRTWKFMVIVSVISIVVLTVSALLSGAA
ncbi:C4-dicarboxylate ABC transporter [Candidatus Saccharibacteria bacterium 32-49-12]|nr:MAG: C4-dicarboxylate ABC transporter [Candidatus Saccharibacteria bacterium 32-49-12]